MNIDCFIKLLLVTFIGFLVVFQHLTIVENDNLKRTLNLHEKQMIIQSEKILRYEYIISDMMQGQWSPEMGIQKDFVEEWYSTPIYSFKAVHRPPGASVVDIGEIIDRKIEEETK